MGIIILILIAVVVLVVLFYAFKKSKAKAGERTRQDEAGRQAEEQKIQAQQNLHEKEKKRWEDDYWKRQAKGER